jgi:hypothetical protein
MLLNQLTPHVMHCQGPRMLKNNKDQMYVLKLSSSSSSMQDGQLRFMHPALPDAALQTTAARNQEAVLDQALLMAEAAVVPPQPAKQQAGGLPPQALPLLTAAAAALRRHHPDVPAQLHGQ